MALKKLVDEARKSRPKDLKKRQKQLEEKGVLRESGDEEDDEQQDAEAQDEERVLNEMRRERAQENGDDEDEDEEEEDEDEEGEAEDSLQQPIKRHFTHDGPAMRQLAQELEVPDFIESFQVVVDLSASTVDPEDDKERESKFKELATMGVNMARVGLDEHKVPLHRPTDFMAEMIKSDEHMARVKKHLLFEQQKIQAVEARKAAQRNKKRQKEVRKKKADDKASVKRKAAEIADSFRSKAQGDSDKPNRKRPRTSTGSGSSSSKPARMGKQKRKSIKGTKSKGKR